MVYYSQTYGLAFINLWFSTHKPIVYPAQSIGLPTPFIGDVI